MDDKLKHLIFEACNDWVAAGMPVTAAIQAAFMESTGDRDKYPNALDALALLALASPNAELKGDPLAGRPL